MIEQIINWWNSLSVECKIAIGMVVVVLIGCVYVIYDMTIKSVLRNKRKTTTQKYREGLIKK